MNVYIRLKEYYWRFIWLGIATVICMILAAATGFARPMLLKQIVDRVITRGEYGDLPYLALSVMVFALLRSIFAYGRMYIGHVFGAAAVHDLRGALYDKLQSMPFSFYDKARTGDLMSRLAGDVEVFRQFLAFGLANFADFLLMVIMGIILMLSLDWRLTLVTLATTPILVFVVLRFSEKVHKAFSKVRRSASEVNSSVQENITGIRTIKAFAREGQQVDVFEVKNNKYKRAQLSTADLWARYFPFMELLSSFSVILLLWYGYHRVSTGALSIGGFVAFFNLIWYIISPVQQLGFHINLITQAIAGGERIVEILDMVSDLPDGHRIMDPGLVKGEVSFRNVDFSYSKGGNPALQGIDFVARPGSVIGVTGPTGSGKSTLVSLIYRGYDAGRGNVAIDGVDVREYGLASLRHQVACVFQETFLFSTSIKENIRYGRRDATDAEVEESAKLAQAHDFIMELPRGYETLVGERGMGLSGGQKQRIAIARAILANPRIIIFDDATASVDMETELAIQRGMAAAGKGRTVFIIAHRVSSLKAADEILVLDHGRIVERGTHEGLLSAGGHYSRIHAAQLQGNADMGEDCVSNG